MSSKSEAISFITGVNVLHVALTDTSSTSIHMVVFSYE